MQYEKVCTCMQYKYLYVKLISTIFLPHKWLRECTVAMWVASLVKICALQRHILHLKWKSSCEQYMRVAIFGQENIAQSHKDSKWQHHLHQHQDDDDDDDDDHSRDKGPTHTPQSSVDHQSWADTWRNGVSHFAQRILHTTHCAQDKVKLGSRDTTQCTKHNTDTWHKTLCKKDTTRYMKCIARNTQLTLNTWQGVTLCWKPCCTRLYIAHFWLDGTECHTLRDDTKQQTLHTDAVHAVHAAHDVHYKL